jgi:hypothetical protein
VARTFATTETGDTSPSVAARTGAVDTLAAAVTATASARPPGTPRRRRPSAQRGRTAGSHDGGERELPSERRDRSRIEQQRPDGGETERVPARARPPGERGDEEAPPMMPARWIDGPAPASGT